MAKKEERFIRIHSENFDSEVILIDKLTQLHNKHWTYSILDIVLVQTIIHRTGNGYQLRVLTGYSLGSLHRRICAISTR